MESLLLYLTMLHASEWARQNSPAPTPVPTQSEASTASTLASTTESSTISHVSQFSGGLSSAAVAPGRGGAQSPSPLGPPPLPPRPHSEARTAFYESQSFYPTEQTTSGLRATATGGGASLDFSTPQGFGTVPTPVSSNLPAGAEYRYENRQDIARMQSGSYPPTLAVPSPQNIFPPDFPDFQPVSPAPLHFDSPTYAPAGTYESQSMSSSSSGWTSSFTSSTLGQAGDFGTLPTASAGPQAFSAASSFPNEPLGGQLVNGIYISGTSQLHYAPVGTSTTISSSASTATKKKGIIANSMAFAKRFAKEATHEFEKVYTAVVDDSAAVGRFQKYFRFKYIEPFYGEHAVKFFTTASGGESVMMIGYAYITENYFCFSGERASGRGSSDRVSAVISLADVFNVEPGISPFLDRYKDVPRVTPARLAPNSKPNAVIVHDRFGKVHEFYSILSVKQFMSQFQLKWHQALVRRQQAIPLHPPAVVPPQAHTTVHTSLQPPPFYG